MNETALGAVQLTKHIDFVRASQVGFFSQVADVIADSAKAVQRVVDQFFPSNLARSPDLDVIASIALDSGIPVAWVPRSEIVAELVSAATHEDRLAVLRNRRIDILDDCESVLDPLSSEWANECRAALTAMRHGGELDVPAQSHASNILDSVCLLYTSPSPRDQSGSRMPSSA